MRIGVELSTLTPLRTGVGQYTAGLLDALLAHPAVDEVIGYSPRPLPADAPVAHPKLRVRAAAGSRRLPWMMLRLPGQMREDAADLVHFPNYLAPHLSGVRTVVTVHDMTVYQLPEMHPWSRRVAQRILLPGALRSAAAIVAVSESTRRDLLAWFPGLASRTVVIPEGPHVGYLRVTDPAVRRDVRWRYGLPDRFVLSVGAVDPRKNLARLASAIRRLRPFGLPHAVVVTGRLPRETDRLPGVRYLGYVPQEDMPALYSLADASAYPSLSEGFGLPPLESFACGTPVVASNAGALAEVAGDGARLVDPLDEDGLVAALRDVLLDPAVAADLVRRGHAQVARFSWDRAARLMIELYREVLAAAPAPAFSPQPSV